MIGGPFSYRSSLLLILHSFELHFGTLRRRQPHLNNLRLLLGGWWLMPTKYISRKYLWSRRVQALR